jgi:hypothetical protein
MSKSRNNERGKAVLNQRRAARKDAARRKHQALEPTKPSFTPRRGG